MSGRNRSHAVKHEPEFHTSFQFLEGTWRARNLGLKTDFQSKQPLNRCFAVVGTGVDPVTSRFSGAALYQLSYPTG